MYYYLQNFLVLQLFEDHFQYSVNLFLWQYVFLIMQNSVFYSTRNICYISDTVQILEIPRMIHTAHNQVDGN